MGVNSTLIAGAKAHLHSAQDVLETLRKNTDEKFFEDVLWLIIKALEELEAWDD